jgi:L-alanine-DL-glutamate epimerase-like enolase superfamily enzyme
VQRVRIARSILSVRAGPYYQSLILNNNADPLSVAASLHASNASLANETLDAMPNVTLLEAPWANRDAEMGVVCGVPVWPYPEIVDSYALPLEEPGLGMEAEVSLADEASVGEQLAACKRFVPPLLVARLRGPAERAG